MMKNETARPTRLSPFAIGIVLIVVWLLFFNGWQVLTPHTAGPTVYQTATVLPLATAEVNVRAIPTRLPVAIPAAPAPALVPAVAPTIDGIASNAATAEVLYQTAVVGMGGESGAALETQDKPAVRFHPTLAPAPAATSVPAEAQGGIVNIQETHQCLHGQVWTDSGCRRADGQLSGRHAP